MKSYVSDQLRLMEAVYIDATMKCVADVSDYRDLKTIRSRTEKEGISFLTITLPQFCKDFERSLANGVIDSSAFKSFKKVGAIPALLQGMLSQLFSVENGRILHEQKETTTSGSCADSATSGEANESRDTVVSSSGNISDIVESVRQICLTFSKVEIECTPSRVQLALARYVSIEHTFVSFSPQCEETIAFGIVSSVLWNTMVSSIELSKCIPKHGPGATAEYISGNLKYNWSEWNDCLEPYFPLIGNGYPLGLPSDSEELKSLTVHSMGSERPVRVVPVPKTLKGPRIIAIEPSCMQFAQQGIMGELVSSLESYWLTAGHVNFRDQHINQSLAISASISGRLATIDLSDASDRVPLSLALVMFQCHPDLSDAIEACRSTSAQLPNGKIISPLRKFASMGSALCFPIEAMYFYTVCVIALLKEHNLPVTPLNIFRVTREVHIYGDDIIVPTMYATSVLDHLRKYNCKVNTNKTFGVGKFRESCGIDAYAGKEVTPVYLRKVCPENRRQSSAIISWVATANLFYRKGYWRTTDFMRKRIEALIGPLPYVSETSSALGHLSYLGYRSVERWNRNLQRFEIKGWVPTPVYRTDILEGYGALSKSLLGLEQRENAVPDSLDAHALERSALHGAVTLKRRWVPSLS
jgi:hypothetical protein